MEKRIEEGSFDNFIFQMGDEIINKKFPNIVAIVGKLGKGSNGKLAYQLFFHKSKASGKFYLKEDVEREFELYRR